jgi:adenine/guanine phosphoribosyltransferase-like PRPP-binding protein
MQLFTDVSLVLPANQTRAQIVHRFDGRYEPMNPKELVALVGELASTIDVSGIDYVLGFPEGGVLPAFAFAQLVDRPLVLSTRLQLDMPGIISFEEPHSGLGTTHYIQGLRDGHRVVIVEDEVTTGRTVISAARALRASGVRIGDVCALLVVDDPRLRQAMQDERLRLHARFRLPARYAQLLGVATAE